MVYRSLFHLSGFLIDGYWWQSGSNPIKWNLSDSGPSAQHGVLTYNLGSNWFDGSGISNGRKTLVRDAFEYLSNVTGINFVETVSFSNVDIAFGDKPDGAYSQMWDSNGDGFLERTIVNVSNNWSGGSNREDDYVIQTILHEIGHALGLGHMGIYNGSATYPRDAKFTNDSWQNSIMSYFSQAENTKVSADFAFLQTYMAADLLALNRMYGPQSFAGNQFGTKAAFLGNTTYGFNSTISESDDPILSRMWKYGDTNAYTIVDGGGIDTLDFSGWNASQKINLSISFSTSMRPSLSDIGGKKGNLALGVGTIIENAIGGSGNDTISGNRYANDLFGGNGNDHLYGQAGSDKLYGQSGNDKIYVAAGNDLYDGGSGTDWVVFSGDSRFFVNLASVGPQNTNRGLDTFVDIENITGSKRSDVFTGNEFDNVIQGNKGHDRLDGGGGDDWLFGATHNDSLFGGEGSDHLYGGSHNDALYGNQGDDFLFGGSESDKLYGGLDDDVLKGENGSDILVGGSGKDMLYAGVDTKRDVFVFQRIEDSLSGADRDQIFQFDSREDDINLRQIDANTSLAGDQNFAFSGSGARPHSVWIEDIGSNLLVHADVDGDALSDFEVEVVGVGALHGYDFVL